MTLSARARFALKVIAALVIAALLAVAIHRLIFLPHEAAETKAAAITQEESAQATAGAASDALTITNETQRDHARADTTTRSNDHAIKSAADAGTRAPAVAAVLRDSLCQRAAYHREPDCAALRGDGGGVGPAGRDAGDDSPVE